MPHSICRKIGELLEKSPSLFLYGMLTNRWKEGGDFNLIARRHPAARVP
jgi:hypothetical protein